MQKQKPVLTIGKLMQNYGKGMHRIPAEVLEESVIKKSGQKTKLSHEEQKKLDSDLRAAVRWSAVQEVNELLEKGADVNAKDNDGWTALLLASRYDYAQTAELLIQKGADVNTKHAGGDTPLMIAVKCGHTKTAELLIKHGAKGALPKLKLFLRKRSADIIIAMVATTFVAGLYFAFHSLSVTKPRKTETTISKKETKHACQGSMDCYKRIRLESPEELLRPGRVILYGPANFGKPYIYSVPAARILDKSGMDYEFRPTTDNNKRFGFLTPYNHEINKIIKSHPERVKVMSGGTSVRVVINGRFYVRPDPSAIDQAIIDMKGK